MYEFVFHDMLKEVSLCSTFKARRKMWLCVYVVSLFLCFTMSICGGFKSIFWLLPYLRNLWKDFFVLLALCQVGPSILILVMFHTFSQGKTVFLKILQTKLLLYTILQIERGLATKNNNFWPNTLLAITTWITNELEVHVK